MSMPVNNLRTILLSGLPVLLLVATIALVAWQLTQTRPFPTGNRLTLHQALQEVPENGSVSNDFEEKVVKTLKTARDPYYRDPALKDNKIQTAATVNEVELVELNLSTIARGKLGSYCMINGQIYHEGQTGQGFIVRTIQPDGVTFSTEVQDFTLQPGKKAAIEGGRLINREDKSDKPGINDNNNG